MSRRNLGRRRARARRAAHVAAPAALLVSCAVAFGSPDAGSSAASDFRCRGAIATLVGTAGDDVLRGTPHDDVIVARAGDDLVRSGKGDDKVCDNNGTDHVVLGDGNDEAGGGRGSDRIEGGKGNDWLAGRRGNDRIKGGRGRDRIIGELGDDTLRGGTGNDNLGGGPGTDDCRGGPGDDEIHNCESGDSDENHPPVARDDADSTSEMSPKDVNVLANDSDADGDPLIVSAVDTTGTAGQVSLAQAGTLHTAATTGHVEITGGGTGIRYDPAGGFNALAPGESATDTFRYQLAGGTGFATVTITIAGVDTPPTAVADTGTVTEDGGTLGIDALANDTDPDAGAAKSIQSVSQPANGTAAITGGGTGLTYAPNADYCNSGGVGTPDSFTYTLAPGGSMGTVGVTVTCVNDAPVLNVAGTQLAYSEGAGAIPVDAALTATDVDSASLQGAVVQITGNFSSAQDDLVFTDQNGITGSYDDSTGTLTLTGSSSVANYQTALRSVRYQNTSDTPSTATRTVSFRVTDSSSADSLVDTRTIGVTPTNDPPTVTTSGGNASYTEGNPASTIDGGLTVADPDDTNLEGATVRVSSGFQSGDDLVFVNQNGISGVYNTGTGVLSLTGTASKANYQTALRSIQFRTTHDNPSSSKTIEFKANDGDGDGPAATRGVSVTGVNDAPALTTSGSALSYSEGSGPVAVDPGLTATDPDSANLQGATVQITGNFSSAEDDLAFTNQLGITGSYNDSTGTLTLTGTASVANYQAALRSVTYTNSSDNPSGSRTVSFQATDSGSAASNVATRDINLSAGNDAPVVNTSGGATSYTEGDPATTIDGALTVSDPDDTNLEGGQGRISAGFQSGDDLVFVNQNGISGVYNTGTGVLTLTGTASVADYQAALRSIKFQTTNDNPGGSRTVEFKLNDGVSDSNAATKNVAVTGVNDAPVLSTTGSALSYTEGDGPVAVDSGLTASDPDSANLQGATVQITGNFSSAEDDLAFTNQSGISGTYDDSTGTLTLTGTSSVANYQAALRSVTYENSSDTPSTATRTVSFQATDSNGAASNVATRDIDVSPSNDAPTVTTTAGNTNYAEGDPATTIDGGITVADVDDANLEGGQVRISANFQSGDDLVFVNQNGISGVYNTGTGVLTLTGTASVADYQTALRSIKFQTTNLSPSASKTVEFKVNDGDADSNAATKNIAISGQNSAPAVGTGGTLNYTENDPATAVDSGLTLTEPEGDNISGASASITSGFQSGEDALSWVDNNGSDAVTLAGSSTAQTIVLTGTDTAANYQAALRAVKYANSSESPSTTSRTVTFSATDEFAATGTGTRTIAVSSVDDLPTAVDDSATVLEDAAATSIDVLANDIDADGGPKTISSVSNLGNGTVVLTGGSPGAWTGLTYEPDPDYCNAPPGTSLDTFNYTLNGGDTGQVSVTVTCVNDAPVADDETFDGANSAVGNTTFVGNDPDDGAPATPDPTDTAPVTNRPHKTVSGDILAGDTDVDGPGPLTVTPGTFATNDGGSVTIQADGDFTFEPAAATSCTDTSDFFDYTVSDNAGSPQSDTGRVTINITGCVWYVNNDDAQGNSGTSEKPFDTLAQAETASGTGHSIFVYDGNDTTSGYAAGINLKANQKLIGEAAALTVGSDTLHSADAANKPSITDNNADVVDLDDGTEVKGFNIDPQGTGGGIAGSLGDTGGGTIDDVNIVDTGTPGTEAGLELDSTTGTFNVSNLTVQTSEANGVDLNTAGTVDFGSTSITTAGAKALDVTGTNMGTSTFDAITVTGSDSGGVNVVNATGSTTFGDGTGTDLALTTTSGSAPAFNLSNAGSITVGSAGTDDVSATGGPAIDVTSTSGATLDFDDVDSTNSANDGVNLAGLGAGTFSAATGTIGGAAGVSFDLDGGSGNVTYPGDLNNGSGQAVEVTNRSGGAATFSGPIADTSDAGGGILLSSNTGGSTTFSNASKVVNTTTPGSPTQNNAVVMNASDGHALTLSGGGLDIDTTTGKGLEADTSGTLVVSGANNAIDTTTGRGLNISATDIGAGGVTFKSISSNGAANGILLNNTGSSGGLTVTGNGDSTVGGDNSGGTIQGTTGFGVSLANTKSPSFTNVRILNSGDSGVNGTQVSGFSFTNGTITGAGDADDENSITFDDSLVNANVTGAVTITGNVISGTEAAGVDIQNFAGTVSDANISNNTLSDTGDVATPGSAISLVANGSASTVGSVTKAELTGNTITDFRAGAGFVAQGGNATSGGPSGTMGVSGDATNKIAITGNLMNGGSGGIGNQPDRFVTASVHGVGQGNFDVSNNGTSGDRIRNIDCIAIEITADGPVNMTSNVQNNFINANSAVGCAGISVGTDQAFAVTDAGTHTSTISGNNVMGTDGPGIFPIVRNSASSMTVKVLNNTVAAPITTSAARAGIRVDSGSASGDTTLCLEISGNTTAGSTNNATSTTSPGINLRKQGTDPAINTFGIEGMAATASPGVENYVNSLNTSTSGTFGTAGTALLSATSGFTNCTAP